MGKIILAVAEVISSERWMTSYEIQQELDYPAPVVRGALTSLVRSGAIKRKDNPDIPRGVLYQSNRTQDENGLFGVSEKLAVFDKLLCKARSPNYAPCHLPRSSARHG